MKSNRDIRPGAMIRSAPLPHGGGRNPHHTPRICTADPAPDPGKTPDGVCQRTEGRHG